MNFLRKNFTSDILDVNLYGNLWNPLRHMSFQQTFNIWIGEDDSDYLIQFYLNIAFICFNIMFSFTILRKIGE